MTGTQCQKAAWNSGKSTDFTSEETSLRTPAASLARSMMLSELINLSGPQAPRGVGGGEPGDVGISRGSPEGKM